MGKKFKKSLHVNTDADKSLDLQVTVQARDQENLWYNFSPNPEA